MTYPTPGGMYGARPTQAPAYRPPMPAPAAPIPGALPPQAGHAYGYGTQPQMPGAQLPGQPAAFPGNANAYSHLPAQNPFAGQPPLAQALAQPPQPLPPQAQVLPPQAQVLPPQVPSLPPQAMARRPIA